MFRRRHLAAETIQEATRIIPNALLVLTRHTMSTPQFSDEWKRSNVVLAPKQGDKYRSICPLDTLKNIKQQNIKHCVVLELGDKNGMSEIQLGFGQGRSTVDTMNQTLIKPKTFLKYLA
ncbi:hypothetical protein JTB14_011512 [Gonioctena quinquepunctata]|nr:hypothetical protein JTB14_011512 [Gonioctena quinquepunctata]